MRYAQLIKTHRLCFTICFYYLLPLFVDKDSISFSRPVVHYFDTAWLKSELELEPGQPLALSLQLDRCICAVASLQQPGCPVHTEVRE